MQIKTGLALSVMGLLWAGLAGAEPVQKADAEQAVEQWVRSSVHFKYKKTRFFRASYTVHSVEKMTLGAGTMPLYAVTLDPSGYVVMNSDRRLPPVLAYSASGSLNLDDVPQNAFRAMLKRSMDQNLRAVLGIQPVLDLTAVAVQSVQEERREAAWDALLDEELLASVKGYGGVTNGPFLTTAWNQNNHYNELCPDAPGTSAYYDEHAAVGCVAVVGAQIMNYYEWPYRGTGGHSYTDSDGSMTGAHSVVFSDPYDWDNMQDSYYAWGSEPQAAVDAVSELMYEAGVAVEMDYESYENGGSASYTSHLNTMMNQAFLYEKGSYLYNYGTNAAQVADQIRADMLANRPAEISIYGHAVVADGHVDDGVNEYFHINYGWGGQNDAWYLIDDITGDPAYGCISGLYPAMIPVNVTESGQTNHSPDLALQWALADVRTAEVQSVSVLSHVLKTNTFSDPCEDFSKFQITSTDDYKDWAVAGGGYSGDCFYKEPGGYGNWEYHLTSIEKFVPRSGSQLQFRLKTYLASDVFRLMVSVDDGQTFSEVASYDPGMTWTLITADLSSYAGSEILIRFEYVVAGYYPSGGVWLDSISYTDGSWYDWKTLQSFSSVTGGTVTNLPEGTNTLALQAYDGSESGARSPSFTVIVQSSQPDADDDGLPNWWETFYFGGITNANPAAMAANGVNTVLEAYVAGLNPTNPASVFETALTRQNGFVVRWNATSGRVYSVLGSTNLQSSFQPLETNILWPQSSWTDTTDRTEGYYRVDVQLE